MGKVTPALIVYRMVSALVTSHDELYQAHGDFVNEFEGLVRRPFAERNLAILAHLHAVVDLTEPEIQQIQDIRAAISALPPPDPNPSQN